MQVTSDTTTIASNDNAVPPASNGSVEVAEIERLRSVVNNSHIAYIVINSDCEIRWTSPLAQAWLQTYFSAESIDTGSLQTLFTDSGNESFNQAIDSTIEGQSSRFDCIFIHPDGEERRYELNFSSASVEPSNVTEILVEIIDVRRRTLNTGHLLAGDTFFTSLVQNSSDIITLLDSQGQVRYMSPAIEQVLGFPTESLIERRGEELIHPDDLKRLKRDFLLTNFTPDTQLAVSFRVQHANGGWIHLESVATNLLHDKSIQGFVVNSRNVTERKEAEQVLAMEKNWLSVTLKSIGDGVITTDITGRNRMLNPSAEKLTGVTQAQAQGKDLDDIFHVVDPQTHERIETPLATLLAHSEIADSIDQTYISSHADEGILIAKDGSEKIISQSGALIRDAHGQIMGMVLVFRDVTHKQRLADEINRASRLESIGILAGGIAHDFNNILLAIIGNVTLARTEIEENTDAHTRLLEAENGSFRARDLTQQLLTFAKGGTPLLNTLHLHEIIRESVEFMLHGSNVELTLDLPENLSPVDVDAGQIGQVLTNLTVNAQQAMPDGGRLDVIAKNLTLEKKQVSGLSSGNYVSIEVRDTGTGIPDDIKQKLFDPFFTTKDKGSGLGLATAYSIIKKHHGIIEINSTVGKGSSFTIYLPASTSSPEIPLQGFKEDLKGKGRLLLMDDDEHIRMTTPALLADFGYIVDTVNNGDEMLQKYKEATTNGTHYDCVIMDLTIPGGMGGKEAITKLRKLDPQAKAIVSSGYSQDAVMACHKEHGFDGFLEKPYRSKALARLIKQVLSSVDIPSKFPPPSKSLR